MHFCEVKIKLLLIICGVAIFCSSSFASTPPIAVASTFQKMYPYATKVTWKKENAKLWQAVFILKTNRLNAKFTHDGVWLNTNRELLACDLPPNIAASIKLKYPDWTIIQVQKNEISRKGCTYKTRLKKGLYIKILRYQKDGTQVPA